jgi:uncharacterized protein (DUF1015 family)
MVQVAGFRGAVLNPYRVEAGQVAAAAITGVKARLANEQLVRDSHVSIYRYHQLHGGRTRKTTLAIVELEPWSVGTIRAHEKTSRMARELASRGIATEAAHTEAVFCGYRDDKRELDRLLAPVERQQPALVVSTPDGTVHTVWRESDPHVLELVHAMFTTKILYVLDGHARYEGMLGYRDSLGDLAEHSCARYGLASLVHLDDVAHDLAPRHRVVRGPSSRANVLTAAKPFFDYDRISGAAENPDKQRAALSGLGDRSGFLALFPDDPDGWRFALKADVPVGARQTLDPAIVEEVFLARVVPDAKARSVLEASTVMKAVDDGAVGLILRPISFAHVLEALDSGHLLPFGSTAFHPALARLVTFLIDPAELIR